MSTFYQGLLSALVPEFYSRIIEEDCHFSVNYDRWYGATKECISVIREEALTLLDKFTFKEISNMTGISERTLYRASQKFDER